MVTSKGLFTHSGAEVTLKGPIFTVCEIDRPYPLPRPLTAQQDVALYEVEADM